MKDFEKQIRERWFPDHQATLTDHGDLKALVWKKQGTISYYVRYVFDGFKMYVSGDLGEAVFCFTEKADVHNQAEYDLDYFEGKLRAYHESKVDFNSDKAVKRLREWVKDLKKDGREYDHDEMRDLFDAARGCSSKEEWTSIVSGSDFINDLDCDYWDWMYNIGDETPMRLLSYLIGLKMASEQLKVVAATACTPTE